MSSANLHDAPQTREPPFHVVACDVDGSLLNESHEVTGFTKQTVQRLIESYRLSPAMGGSRDALESTSPASEAELQQYQVFFVLASGRHVLDLSSILQSLQLPEYSGYIVSSNGARAHCSVHRAKSSGGTSGAGGDSETAETPSAVLEEVFSAFLLPSQVRRLLSLVPAGDTEINVNVYRGDGWHCSLDWTDELQYYKSGFAYTLFDPQDWIATYDAFVTSEQERSVSHPEAFATLPTDANPSNPLHGVEKIFFGSDNTDRIHALSRVLRNEVDEHTGEPLPKEAATEPGRFRVTATFSSKYCIEATAEGVTKASGIDHLMPYLQSRSGDSAGRWTVSSTCIAFGDGENDEVMLRCAARGCLMGNSSEGLRRRLAEVPTVEVIGSNTEDGIAKKLIEVFHLHHVTR